VCGCVAAAERVARRHAERLLCHSVTVLLLRVRVGFSCYRRVYVLKTRVNININSLILLGLTRIALRVVYILLIYIDTDAVSVYRL